MPAGTVKLRVHFASGGAGSVVGTMVIDDLSVRISKPVITELALQAGRFDLSWFRVSNKADAVQFDTVPGSSTAWTPLATKLVSGGLSMSYSDTAIPGGNSGFYPVIQE